MINASQTKINHTLASVSCLLIVCPLQLVSHVYVLVSFFFSLAYHVTGQPQRPIPIRCVVTPSISHRTPR